VRLEIRETSPHQAVLWTNQAGADPSDSDEIDVLINNQLFEKEEAMFIMRRIADLA
jgi:hypothetical protein